MLNSKFLENDIYSLLQNELEAKYHLDSRVASQLALNFIDLIELSDGDLELLQTSILEWN